MSEGMIQWMRKKAIGYSKSRSRVGLYELLEGAARQYIESDQSKVLNVGSGGPIGQCLTGAGVDFVSLDVDPARGPDIVGTVEDLGDFGEASFDAVFMMEVLEHVADPFAAAKSIHQALKPGGVLIGSTPFILGIHEAPRDFYRYTKFGLRHVFKDFSEVELVPRNEGFKAAGVLPLRRIVLCKEEEVKTELLRLPLIVLAELLLRLAGRLRPDPDAPTGYFFVFRKES